MSTAPERTASELSRALGAGEHSSVALCREYLDQIEKHDGQVRAFLHVDAADVLAQAERSDARRAAGEPRSPLEGIPVAIKDVLCTLEAPTTCGSRMLENFRAPYDATVVRRLKEAGAVILGKTNMDEFAMGGSTENSAYFPTRNPWDLARSPGGSSGGAAAAVAAGMAPLSLGSDTGGSIRQPAALCGIVGLKPTYGRVSRLGLVAFASSFDQVGPLARTVEDAALLLETIAGHDPKDSTSTTAAVPEYSAAVRRPLAGLRVGVVREHYDQGLDGDVEAAVREAIEQFRALGAEIREVSLPHSRYGVAAYYVIAPSEASSNLARYDGAHYGYRTDETAMHAELEQERKALSAAGDERGLEGIDSPLVRMYRKSRSEGFGAEVKRRIMLGAYALSAGYYDAYYLKALKVRRLIRDDFDQAFREVDLIAGPTTPGPAFLIGSMVDDPLAMYLVDLYTVPANLAGLPGLSIPCGASSSGLPIGLQLQAPLFEEERLLRAGYMYQQATDWHKKRPNLSRIAP
jgi:aspartyl-tRNA(Asn)/glutamyl-tRNA(Gln) amidotransferase subunit A